MNRLKRQVKYQAGFSLLELIVVIVIVAILFGLALNHLLKWRVTAEQASVHRLIAEMRGAIKLQVASQYAKGQLHNIVTLVGNNPLNFASETPDSYIGEQDSPNIETVEPGHWVFDTSKKLLIYRVRYPDYFTTKLKGTKRIEFKVLLVYTDKNGNNQFNIGVDTIEGLRLHSANTYSWKIK